MYYAEYTDHVLYVLYVVYVKYEFHVLYVKYIYFMQNCKSCEICSLCTHLLIYLCLFWNLYFTSAKQAVEVHVQFQIPDKVWDAKWKQISSEHDEDGALDQLRSGWKVWLA